MSADLSDLKAHAERFAKDLGETFVGVLGGAGPSFEALYNADSGAKLVVQPLAAEPIPLCIDASHALDLTLQFQCNWDSTKAFLKVEKADYHVFPAGGGTPLFRYEFVDKMQDTRFPSAHLQLHAHRDEFLFAMLRSPYRKPKARANAATGGKGKVPMLASVHFPLGGPRFRPCVEDVLQMLIHEFDIDHDRANAAATLDSGREQWRRLQTRAVARDAPAEAVSELRSLGYEIAPPSTGDVAENPVPLRRV